MQKMKKIDRTVFEKKIKKGQKWPKIAIFIFQKSEKNIYKNRTDLKLMSIGR